MTVHMDMEQAKSRNFLNRLVHYFFKIDFYMKLWAVWQP